MGGQFFLVYGIKPIKHLKKMLVFTFQFGSGAKVLGIWNSVLVLPFPTSYLCPCCSFCPTTLINLPWLVRVSCRLCRPYCGRRSPLAECSVQPSVARCLQPSGGSPSPPRGDCRHGYDSQPTPPEGRRDIEQFTLMGPRTKLVLFV